MITLRKQVYLEPPAAPVPDVGDRDRVYHVLEINLGRTSVAPADYAVDGEPVTAEEFDRVMRLVSLPNGTP